MITAAQCLEAFGPPETERYMILWDVPARLEIGQVPKRVYCHELLARPLERAFVNLISRGRIDELKTWDGCFNIRLSKAGRSLSLHSWGLAVDLNAAWNQFGRPPTLSKEFVSCFLDAGFDWGGYWRKPDGMHFQLKEIRK
jgi:hypothetical protein